MRITAKGVASGVLLLVVASALGALGALGVAVHYAFVAEYGDVTRPAVEELWSGLFAGPGGLALVLVIAVALMTFFVAPYRWLRLTAAAIPVLMLAAMLAATPLALRHKLAVQYETSPQCLSSDMGPGPGRRAGRESQQAFDSIAPVGYFSRGGSSGVGGCDRPFVLLEKVNVLGITGWL
jgi:hypothetical protein